MAWNYTSFGPRLWANDYPIANGRFQSPVNIDTSIQNFDENLVNNQLKVNYTRCEECELVNTGASYKVSLGKNCVISGGPLEYQYELLQFHAHWGKEDDRGAEHTINCTVCPMELHLVHWNKTLYKTSAEAFGSPDGLAVIGVFLNVEQKHDALEIVTSQLNKITFKDDNPVILDHIDPSDLLPEEGPSEYWTYQGSLTTPPLTENVCWIVLRHPITISRQQLEKFRNLRTDAKADNIAQSECMMMTDNFRPIQELHGRTIRASFVD